jgi:hypothetical protein
LNTPTETQGYFVFRQQRLDLREDSLYLCAMKRIHTLALGFLCCLLVSRCGGSEKKPDVKAPEGMVAYDLSKYGKPFSLFVPDTSRSPLRVTEEGSGALLVESGGNFAISIREQAEDLALKKKDVAEDEVNKLHGMVVDSTHALVWESGITTPEFHFVVNRNISGSDYAFEDLRASEHAPFSKDAVMIMYHSCCNTQSAQNDAREAN